MPAWATERLRTSTRKRQSILDVGDGRPVLTVGDGFEDLPPVEQDGALANALVADDLVRTGQAKTALAFGLPFVAVGYPLIWVSVSHGNSLGATLSVFVALYMFGHLLTFAVRARRLLYRVDRRVAEVMGRPVADAMIAHDSRNRPQLPVLVRLMLAPYWPSEAKRARSLETVFGPRVAG